MNNRSVQFFDSQFQRQVKEREYALNPFEKAALGYLKGEALDLGCGLGNLALEAARRGHAVTAVDASSAAIDRIRKEAAQEGLPVRAVEADVQAWSFDRDYDTIVAIGLLMFFKRETAHELLGRIIRRVRPGGRAVVNVLIEGTTFMGMFDPDSYYLFRPGELEEAFTGWTILYNRRENFPAPGDTVKVFDTLIAEK